MNRFLQYLNLAGVCALGLLCVFQWQANRRANLDEIVLQKRANELGAKVSEQSKSIQSLTADLDSFREQLTKTSNYGRDTEEKLRTLERENSAVVAERDQLKTNVASWTEAVQIRDVRLQEADGSLTKLIAERDSVVTKYNSLAERHNGVVKDLNEAIAQLAAAHTNSPASAKK